MAKSNGAGVFKLDNGNWGYRFTIRIDGQPISSRKHTDALGNKLHTKREAIKAREAAIAQARLDRARKQKISRRTVQEVYDEYCAKGRSDRAYMIVRKQDSLWRNHLRDRFGKRFVDDISVAEVNDYLSELYYKDGLAFRYVESFLKMFYLIFGQAYSRNYLDVDTCFKLCKNKDTKIHMPKLKDEDDTDITAFSRSELALLDDYFAGTNAETAYLLGRFCGLRINECYGLKWDHVDLDGGKISSTELVNCLPNGTIQTVNSMKYPTREIKSTLGINFKYHYLRHTFGTMMAEMNTPEHLLCAQMGHGNIHVTQRYYLAVTKLGVDVLKDNLNML